VWCPYLGPYFSFPFTGVSRSAVRSVSLWNKRCIISSECEEYRRNLGDGEGGFRL
jgi:hypothetical protein